MKLIMAVVTPLDDQDYETLHSPKSSRWDVVVCRRNIIAELPAEVTKLILEKLDLLSYHCFSVVCSSWRSIAVAAKQEMQREKLVFSLFSSRPQLPYLMFPSSDEDKSHQLCFSLSHGKNFWLKLPEFCGGRCVGSSLGWLIMTSQLGDNYLLNPVSGVRLQLPRFDSLVDPRDYTGWLDSPFFIRKAILFSPHNTATTSSSSSSHVDCVVVAIYKEKFAAFCRPGDQAWNPLKYEHQERSDFEDIIFYNGQLYAVCHDFDLALLELGSNPRAIKCNVASAAEFSQTVLDEFKNLGNLLRYLYLVESQGQLLMVWKSLGPLLREHCTSRHVCCTVHETVGFKVFKLDAGVPRWVKLESLGDQILFLGTSHGMSISTMDYPQLKGNSVFFTDDTFFHEFYLLAYCTPHCQGIGVFRLKTETIEHCSENYNHSSLCPPFWFTPNPW